MLSNFDNPPKQFRPSPFWSWNDDLSDEELARQVRDFKDKGFGGYFMHSRVGLRTRYLSSEWMSKIATCLREGKNLDLESWLYDEDKWPSGAAGGLVTKDHDELRSRGLSLISSPSANRSYLAVFDLDEKSGTYRMIDASAPAENQKIAFQVVLAPKTNWFNGQSYADLLNPRAVDAFLNVTYDAYAAEFENHFGEFMPGIFTDEPHFRCGDVPWTENFPAHFEKLNGYDILPHLPELFYDLPNSSKTRYDFWRAATIMFVETFSKRLYEWCEKHHIGLTGHYLFEDNLLSQMRHIGAAMPHYQFQQFPGIDHLGRNIDNPLTLMQVSSPAHQLGRKRVLCEIFGVSGHSMSFEDQKWIADFHFALGINFICQHLVLYSMKGERKRDFPPTFSYHQPYWKYYRHMNDYLARCSYAISAGKFAADVLLLHPIPTAWTLWRKGNDEAVHDYNRRFVSLLTSLLGMHIAFDLGDELIMEKHAVVAAKTLSVGEMEYKCVIVPPSKNWGAPVVQLLKRFAGPIVFVGELPTMVAGEQSPGWKELLKQDNAFFVKEDPHEIAQPLEKLISRSISIVDESGHEISDILSHHRVSEKGHLYFLANTSRSKSYAATVRLAATGKVSQWNPGDAAVHHLPASLSESNTTVRLNLPPAGSTILTVEDAPHRKVSPTLQQLEQLPLKAPWSFRRTHPNSITLDRCRLSINNAPLGEWQPVWKARKQVQKHFDLEKYHGIQPWVLQQKSVVLDRENVVQLQFEFEVRKKPERIYLVVEEAFKFTLSVNGQNVDTDTNEWHWDRQFSKIAIHQHVIEGKNEINLQSNYQWDTEIEEIYLVGDFAVQKAQNQRFSIGPEPEKLYPGDWGKQGYPFYSGNMIYQAEVKLEKQPDRSYVLDLSSAKGSLCRVMVNGEEAGVAAWHPWQLDLTRLLRYGRNSIAVEVVSTLRNTMGPLHHKAKDDLAWVGPEQFVDEANWTDEYNFVPYGIFGELKLLVCRRAEQK